MLLTNLLTPLILGALLAAADDGSTPAIARAGGIGCIQCVRAPCPQALWCCELPPRPP